MPTARRGLGLWHVVATLPWIVAVLVARSSIGDNSFLWHVTAGRLQNERGSVLTTDPFSFTMAGESWRTQSWLADIGYAWLDDRVGLAFVPWLRLVVALLVFLGVGLIVWRLTRSLPAIATVSFLGALLAVPYLNPRPVLFSYLLFVILVVVERAPRLRWTLPLVFYLWASLHGSWVLGGAYVALRVLEEREYARIWREGPIVAGVTLLTAHGWGVVEYLLAFGRSGDALDLITEWAPPDLISVARAPFTVAIVVLLLGAAAGRLDLRTTAFAIPILLFGMSSSRSVLPAFLLLVPVLSMAVSGLKPARFSRPLKGATIAVALVLALPLVLPVEGGLDEDRFPRALASALGDRRVFHDDVIGGYLIYSDWPQTSVLVDDRAELYGDFLGEFVAVRSGRSDWRPFFEEWDIEAALVPKDEALARSLAAEGWRDEGSTERLVLLSMP